MWSKRRRTTSRMKPATRFPADAKHLPEVVDAVRKRYSWDAGSLTIDLPYAWRDASDDDAISFSSPGGDAALTITVYTNPVLTAADVDRITLDRKPFGMTFSPKRDFPVANGFGYAQDFRKEEEDAQIAFIAHFLFCPDVTIIASVNGPPAFVEKDRSKLDGLLSSIRVYSKTE